MEHKRKHAPQAAEDDVSDVQEARSEGEDEASRAIATAANDAAERFHVEEDEGGAASEILGAVMAKAREITGDPCPIGPPDWRSSSRRHDRLAARLRAEKAAR